MKKPDSGRIVGRSETITNLQTNASRLLGQWRGTRHYVSIQRNDQGGLTGAIIALATKHGRYGYRRITALLRTAS